MALDSNAVLRALYERTFPNMVSVPYSSPGIGAGGGNMLALRSSGPEYLSPGIGAGGGTMLPTPSQASVEAATRYLSENPPNRYGGMVFGDTIGGAQSAVLADRAQKINAAMQAAARADARRTAERSFRLQQQQLAAALRNQEIDNARQDRALVQSRELADRSDRRMTDASERDYLLRLATLESQFGRQTALDRARSDAATRLQGLSSVGERLDSQSAGAQADLQDLLTALEANGSSIASGNPELELVLDSSGIPSLVTKKGAKTPANMDDLVRALWSLPEENTLAAVAPALGIPASALPSGGARSELNDLLSVLEQSRLGAGRLNSDIGIARSLLTNPVIPPQTASPFLQQLLSGAGARPTVAQAARAVTLPPLPTPARVWRLGANGSVY